MAYNILIVSFIILSIFDIFIKKKFFLILILSFFIYLFFFGFRGFIAWDWFHYYPNWISSIDFLEAIKKEFVFNMNTNLTYEKGYQVWMSILKTFFNNWNVYLFFTTLVDTVLLMIIFYKYSPYPVFSILLFLGFGGIQIQLDLMRNFKALLVFLFSIEYLKNKKNIKYFIFNIFSSSLHRSSLLYLIIGYFLNKNFYKYKKTLLSFFTLGIFVLIFSDKILYEILSFVKFFLENFNFKSFNNIIEKLNMYLNSDYATPGKIGIGFFEKTFSFILFYLYREKINKNEYGKIFFNIFLFYIFSYLYGNGVRIIFERIGLLFICSYWILYPILLKNISNIKRILIFIFLISYCFLKINTTYVLDLKVKKLYEYKNILWNNESYEKKYKVFREVSDNFDMTNKK
ncbi:MAG: EpsG family protein [Fusobacterium sp.]|nr:EpsG family protein [Fusobacterium sp.]